MKNSKFEDEVLKGLASVGLSQKTMSNMFGCHQTAVSARLHKLNIRTYKANEVLEDLFFNLTPTQKEWYVKEVEQLGLKAFLFNLILEKYDDLHSSSSN